jgi:hypothetical protein
LLQVLVLVVGVQIWHTLFGFPAPVPMKAPPM